MSDLIFSSPAKRAVFLRSIARIKARHASKFVPPVHENGAVKFDDSTASGASVGHPDCLFPQPRFEMNRVFGTGSCCVMDLRPGFNISETPCIDAPEYLPSGGADSLLICGVIVGFSQAYRV